MMKEERFWQIIETSREKAKVAQRNEDQDFSELQEHTLKEVLEKIPPQEIVEFKLRMSELHSRAYRWDLWGAAYWMDGGCSDDGFMDFRYCLISLGRDLYTRILANPDVLAETIGRSDIPYMQAEGFGYVPRQVYEELTGEDMPEPDPEIKHPSDPAGERFDFDDPEEMRRRFPRLVERLREGVDDSGIPVLKEPLHG